VVVAVLSPLLVVTLQWQRSVLDARWGAKGFLGCCGWPGIECRRFRATGGCFEDGGEAVVAVVNGVSDCDMAVTGCAGSLAVIQQWAMETAGE